MTDEIVLTLPRQRSFYDVAHLVVGGFAARLDLTVDTLSDLQTALDGLLPRESSEGDVTLTLRLDRGALAGRVGPFDARALRRDIDSYDVLAALEQRFKHRFAERLLAVHHDAHLFLELLLQSLASSE